MSLNLKTIQYDELNARQKENYNFLKLSAVLADYGYITMRLTDDWQGADFIAQHVKDGGFLKVQLKGRLAFGKKYRGKDVYIAFRSGKDWYLFPHDKTLVQVLKKSSIGKTLSWMDRGEYHFPKLTAKFSAILKQYKIPQAAS